jgi:hypothetical protein
VINTQSTSQDSQVTFMENSASKWSIGNDASDSNTFKISSNASGALATDTELKLTNAGDLTITGDLVVTGNRITFGNSEFIHNEVSDTILISAATQTTIDSAILRLNGQGSAACTLNVNAPSGYDGKLYFSENGAIKWYIGNDADDDNLYIGNGATVGSSQSVTIGDDGIMTLGVNTTSQGRLVLWDGGGGNTPAYIQMHSPNGTARYLFIADDGDLRVHTSAPTATGDGTVVGSQS